MQVRTEHSTHDETSAVVYAAGEIDLATIDAFREAMIDAVRSGVRRLVVDLDHVTFIDSTGLGAIVGTHKRMTLAGGTLTVRTAQQRMLHLFDITGLSRFLTVTTVVPVRAELAENPADPADPAAPSAVSV